MTAFTPDTAMALLKAQGGQTSEISSSLKTARQQKNLEKIEAAAQEFEAMFVAEMMKPMFEGIETDGPFGGGKGEEVFRGIMLQEYGQLISKTGAIGMTDSVREHMILMQEQAASAMHAIEPGSNNEDNN